MKFEVRGAYGIHADRHLLSCQALFPTPVLADLCAERTAPLQSFAHAPQALPPGRRPIVESELEGCDPAVGWICGGTRPPDRREQPSESAGIEMRSGLTGLCSRVAQAVSFSYPPYSENNSTTRSQVVFARRRSCRPSLDRAQ